MLIPPPPIKKAQKFKMQTLLDKVKKGEISLDKISEETKQEITNILVKKKRKSGRIFTPNIGAQALAYNSEADILLFGGHPGGGKSGLLLGLALDKHRNSLIVRRAFTDVDGLFRDAQRLVSLAGYELDGFVKGNRPVYNKPNRKGYIAFEGMEKSGGEIDYGKQGRPFDFIGVDEAAQLPLESILMLLGWNRSSYPGQRCRMVLASNPPVNSIGDWMVDFFGPWLDENYENPALPGEIRYFIMDKDGKSVEVADRNIVTIDGVEYYPHSRTFIPSSLADNPYIGSDYKAKLQLLPAHIRDVLTSGNFLVARQDPPNQLIPTDWVRAAIERWKNQPNPPEHSQLATIGFDVTDGGPDFSVIAKNYDGWFDELEKKPAVEVKGGNKLGEFLFSTLDNSRPYICYDATGGYGNGLQEYLRTRYPQEYLIPFKGADKSHFRSKQKFKYVSTRAAAYGKFAEALDPDQPGGSPIYLPDDRRLRQALTIVEFEVTNHGIQITPKKEIIAKLGKKSPDEADAVVMAWYAYMLKGATGYMKPKLTTTRSSFATVGYDNRKRR
jgi:hypothetical protein